MNLINKIILRYIKENGHFINVMEYNNQLGFKNVIFNSCYIDAIMTIIKYNLSSYNFFKKLKKKLEDNEIVLPKKIIIVNFNDENIINISNYFDKNGIIWGSGSLFSDKINEYYFKKNNKNGFYILIDSGFCSYGNFLSPHYKNIGLIINANDFILYFEEIKNNFNVKLKKFLL